MRSIFHIAIREIRIMVSRPIYGFAMVLAPLFCFYFLTSLMGSGLPTELPLGLVDNDETSTTRSLARNLDAFQQTSIVQQYTNVSEARSALQKGEIYGFYYIPKGTTRKAQRQEIPTVSFYSNYSYLVAASLLYRDMRMVSELAGGAATRSVLYAKGATEGQAMAYLQPIVIDTHPIGNPWLNYAVYLCNTLLPGILSLFVFMVTVYSIGTEIKRGTARRWLTLAQGNIHRALVGKLLPQLFVFLLMGTLLTVYLYGYLHFPCRCGIPTMLLVMTLLIMASQGLGVLMITFLPTLRLGLSFASLWGVLSFSLSGMSFPVMAMHPLLQGVSLLFPLRHYFLLYVNCALHGYPLSNALPYVIGLLCFALLPVVLAGRLRVLLFTYKYVP